MKHATNHIQTRWQTFEMNNKILFSLLTLIFFSCKKKQLTGIKPSESKIEKPIITNTEKKTVLENRHCFVNGIIEKNDKKYIVVDYVDFLTGDKATEKAKLNGDAEFDISKSGDTIYFVYSDYYVSNINSKLRTIELRADIKIELLDFSPSSNESGYKTVFIEEFIKKYKNHSLVILKMKNGICEEIKEQFTP